MSVTLINEYKELLKEKEQIKLEMGYLPQGYISKKTIKEKQYYYLQSRVKSKLVSKYLKKTEKDEILKQIELYKKYKALLPKINIRLKNLEQAADLINKDISRKLMLLKISMGMDKLDSKQKNNNISFASTLNAIEGVSISKETQEDIENWRNGNKTFISIFQNTLNRYGFPMEI